MGKFFCKKPEPCSICGKNEIIFKDVRSGLTHFRYCETCYKAYYSKIEDRVKAQVMAEVKAGRKIGMKEALDITKEITAEVEADQALNLRSVPDGNSEIQKS